MRPLSVPWSRWFSNQLDASLAHVLMCFSRHSRVFPSTLSTHALDSCANNRLSDWILARSGVTVTQVKHPRPCGFTQEPII